MGLVPPPVSITMPPRSGVEYETEPVPVCANACPFIIRIAARSTGAVRMMQLLLASHEAVIASSLPSGPEDSTRDFTTGYSGIRRPRIIQTPEFMEDFRFYRLMTMVSAIIS